jgi:hypothetical protein
VAGADRNVARQDDGADRPGAARRPVHRHQRIPRHRRLRAFRVYWAATREGIYEHTEPTPQGYRVRTVYRRGETIPVRHAGADLRVDALLAPDET